MCKKYCSILLYTCTISHSTNFDFSCFHSGWRKFHERQIPTSNNAILSCNHGQWQFDINNNTGWNSHKNLFIHQNSFDCHWRTVFTSSCSLTTVAIKNVLMTIVKFGVTFASPSVRHQQLLLCSKTCTKILCMNTIQHFEKA